MTNSKPGLDLIIYGGPGSGKSTQAELLVEKLRAKHMNMGGLLRKAVAKKRSSWRDIKKYMDKGELVPERITSQLVHDFVAKVKRTQRIVFDGYPRRLLQIRLLKKVQDKFNRKAVMFFLYLPASTAKERIIRRAKLEKRLDDANPKIVAERISVFNARAKEVINYYQKERALIKIDGNQTIEKVARDIWEVVSAL